MSDEVGITAEDALTLVVALAGEVAQRESALTEAVKTASALGVTVRDLAEAMGTSKSSVHRRMTGSQPGRVSRVAAADDGFEDDELDAWVAEMRAAQLRLAQLKVMEASQKVKYRADQARLIEEANSLTRVGPLDFDI
jgi:hypothetical protein